jgi:hypothetical protein
MRAGTQPATIKTEQDDDAAGIAGADDKKNWVVLFLTAALLIPHGCPMGGRFRFLIHETHAGHEDL